VLMLSFTK
ncbi:hypothetical protein PGANDO_0783, partial [Porphyromonas gingivalis]